jgi:hypothetical protein
MLIECLIKRVGPTPIELGKTRYLFMPLPDSRWFAMIDGVETIVNSSKPFKHNGSMIQPYSGNKRPRTSVCEINAEEHLEHLLKSRQFRPYQEDAQEVEEENKPNLSGYKIVKHGPDGYRIENTNTTPTTYVGSNGVWRTDTVGLLPFDTEFIAWQWIKDEAEFAATDAVDAANDATKNVSAGKPADKVSEKPAEKTIIPAKK